MTLPLLLFCAAHSSLMLLQLLLQQLSLGLFLSLLSFALLSLPLLIPHVLLLWANSAAAVSPTTPLPQPSSVRVITTTSALIYSFAFFSKIKRKDSSNFC
jgi:hypothetical protein